MDNIWPRHKNGKNKHGSNSTNIRPTYEIDLFNKAPVLVVIFFTDILKNPDQP